MRMERRSAPQSFIPNERVWNRIEYRRKTALFRATSNINTGNCPQEEMEGDAHQTTKRKHYCWDLECPHFKSVEKTESAQLMHWTGRYKWDLIGLSETHSKKVCGNYKRRRDRKSVV